MLTRGAPEGLERGELPDSGVKIGHKTVRKNVMTRKNY